MFNYVGGRYPYGSTAVYDFFHLIRDGVEVCGYCCKPLVSENARLHGYWCKRCLVVHHARCFTTKAPHRGICLGCDRGED